jgi:hypothetical protein
MTIVDTVLFVGLGVRSVEMASALSSPSDTYLS